MFYSLSTSAATYNSHHIPTPCFNILTQHMSTFTPPFSSLCSSSQFHISQPLYSIHIQSYLIPISPNYIHIIIFLPSCRRAEISYIASLLGKFITFETQVALQSHTTPHTTTAFGVERAFIWSFRNPKPVVIMLPIIHTPQQHASDTQQRVNYGKKSLNQKNHPPPPPPQL